MKIIIELKNTNGIHCGKCEYIDEFGDKGCKLFPDYDNELEGWTGYNRSQDCLDAEKEYKTLQIKAKAYDLQSNHQIF